MATTQGSYVGNGAADRTIPLAFTPKFVVVVGEVSGQYYYISNVNTGARGFQFRGGSTPQGLTTNITRPALTTNGFIVSGTSTPQPNTNTVTFHYYAIG